MSIENDLKRTTKILDAVLAHFNLEVQTKPCHTCYESGYLQDGGECFKCDGYGATVHVQ